MTTTQTDLICRPCHTGLAHCHDTLVVHADGTLECESWARCLADELMHDLWVPCTTLSCGCTGDEWTPLLELAEAA